MLFIKDSFIIIADKVIISFDKNALEVLMADRKKLEIELKSLWFDERNPRLPIRLQGETDENKIIDYMVKYGNIVELMLSIAEMGYSDAEPLLVV